MTVYEYVQNSAQGLVRPRNEDAVFAASEGGLGLFAVADGMGGHDDGQLASRIVAEELSDCWTHLLGMRASLPPQVAVGLLRSALDNANSRIFARNTDGRVCGTTVVLALLAGKSYTVFSSGDSRAYLYRGRVRPLARLTVDHTWENYQCRLGELSRREIKNSPLREKLLQAVGVAGELQLSVRTDRFDYGQGLLLCSDGLYKAVGQGSLRAQLGRFTRGGGGGPLSSLFDEAYRNGAPDNLSAIMVRARDAV